MNRIGRQDRSKWFCLAVVLIGVFALFLTQATSSGLWYDESIEYYYSKYINGPVPGGRNTYSMFERICSTYQPPLYNWLMYIWLHIFDSEFGFRLAGILTTLVGAIGFFLAADKLTDHKWATAGTCAYLLSGSVSYYALECAEYNLMLCLLSWVLYFFVLSMKEEKTIDLSCFFLFACLTMYSQYGAVFIIVPLYVALAIHYIKNKKRIKEFLVLSSAAALLGGLLIALFMYPQMVRQGTVAVSHMPYFSHKNIIFDFFFSIVKQMSFSFGGGRYLALLISGIAALMTLAAAKKERLLSLLIIICVGSWILYYIVVACSFYGYNNWSTAIGTQNIGGKYGLAFTPFWMLLLVFGVHEFVELIKEMNIGQTYKIVSFASTLMILLFCLIGIRTIVIRGAKDDVREVVQAWYAEDVTETKTLVHQWSDANFQFYLTHHDHYSQALQNDIEAADTWIRHASFEEMEDGLTKMGYLSLNEFYYVAPAKAYSESYNAFIKVVESNGFSVVKLYEGSSALLLVMKAE